LREGYRRRWPELNPFSEEFFISSGFGMSRRHFLVRTFLIGAFMFLLDSLLYRFGMLTDPVRMFVITAIPMGMFLLSPLLARMNLASKLEKNMWAFMSVLWLLQEAGRSVGESLRSIASISEDKEVSEYFNKASDRLMAAGTIDGLETNIRISPSSAWAKIYSRIRDYYFTRGEAIGEMLKQEVEDTVERTLIGMRKSVELLMMVLIIYVIVATVFPFVSILMFTFESLVSGFGGGGLSNIVFLTSVLPAPFFVVIFKVMTPKYFYFPGEKVAVAWGTFLAGTMLTALILLNIPSLHLTAPGMLGEFLLFLSTLKGWEIAAFSIFVGALAGTIVITGTERNLYGIAFEFPSFLEDLFTELRTGKSFSSAIAGMKASYRSLKEFMMRVKYWAELRMPYSDMLEGMANMLKQSVSRMSTMLIITALKSGVDLHDAFGTISRFMTRTREIWYELEAEKKGNYITAVLSYLFVMVSMVIMVTMLNLPVPSQQVADSMKDGLMMQALMTSILLALTLGTIRTGHVTSSLRELTAFSLAALICMHIIASWNPPIQIIGGMPG